MKKTCLFVGDGCVSSGFARMNHKYLEALHPDWDIVMLALNYDGDPHNYPYKIYPCISRSSRHPFGLDRIGSLIDKHNPDVVAIVNDPWNFKAYLDQIDPKIPTVGSVAVDGLNCRGDELNRLKHCIFWTQFGLDQARLGGYEGPATVVPLGVDLSVYFPTAQEEARRRAGLPASFCSPEAFIVGAVGRNQPRKRLDLVLHYFAEWIKTDKIDNAFLFLHIGPTGDRGYDIDQLVRYLDIRGKVLVSQPEPGHGIPEEKMTLIYSSMNVMLNIPQGEGWGLCAMESMACGIRQICADWSAYGEWARPAAYMVPCSSIACTPNNVNVVGGVADEWMTIEALRYHYASTPAQVQLDRQRGLELVRQPKYGWKDIGRRFRQILEDVVTSSEVVEEELSGVSN